MTFRPSHVHGMAGEDVPAAWPPLDANGLHAVLARYPDLDGPIHVQWRSPRPFSSAARVRTRQGEVFVKRHHRRIRTAATLGEEHAFIAHLRERGLPVPALVHTAHGHTAIELGDWTWELHAPATGLDRFRDTHSWTPLTEPELARAAGAMLARLHQAAADYHAPQRATHVLVTRDDLLRAPDLDAAIAEQCAHRPGLAGYLHDQPWPQAINRLRERHQALQPRLAALPRLWTHNDWHVSNLFWSSPHADARVSSVLDFGLAAPTFALHDLATAIERNAVDWLHLDTGMAAIHPRTARALMDGYAQIRPLSAADRQLLAALLPLVHLDFALSEVEYFHAILERREQADVAWHTFALGHAHWFDSAAGQALLDALA